MAIDGLGRVDVIHLTQLREIAFYRRIFNNLENSALCRLFCVFLNGSNLYDDCMLAVFITKLPKTFLIHSVLLCTNCLFL